MRLIRITLKIAQVGLETNYQGYLESEGIS